MKKLLLLLSVLFFQQNAYAQAPTWSQDIACIVYSHCSSCHNDNGIGPFTLMSYQDAYNYRYAMETNIVNRTMPPWPPNQDYRAMAHANYLTDEEIATFQAWVAGGALEGDPTEAPEPPVINTSAGIENPDESIVTDLYEVPSINNDLYRCFIVPTAYGEDKFINQIEVFPNNRNIVHHILLYYNVSQDPINEENADPDYGYNCGGSLEDGDHILIGEWVPGSRPWTLPEGTGIRIPENATLVMQVHYPDGSDGQTDFITININWEDSPNPREVFQDQTLDHIADIQNGPLFLLPYETKTFHEKFVLPEARTFLGTAPHAHLICTKMWSYAVLPSGEVINMVEIPNWDFDWQGMYYYPEPIILPAGTELHGYARYQNDNDNPNNPNNPPTWISLGEDTEDEMMIFFYSYMYYQQGDEDIQMAGLTHEHHNGCNAIVNSNEDILLDEKVKIYPNPVTNNLTLELLNSNQNVDNIQLINLDGKTIFQKKLQNNLNFNISNDIPNGVYFLKMENSEGLSYPMQKIVIMR